MSTRCLEIIPVIDVLEGKVVHAVAGDRSRYRPLTTSILTSSPDPYALLERLAEKGFGKVYIADLNAITHGEVTIESLIEHACKLGLTVLADIGRAGLKKSGSTNVRYIIGTEYLSLNEIELLRDRIVSIDLDGEFARTLNGHVHYSEIVRLLAQVRPCSVLVLRLDLVGTGRGVDNLTVNIVRCVRSLLPGVELLYGGGVRGIEDLRLLASEGVQGVLVATALHRGIITSSKLCFDSDEGVLT